MMYMDLTLRMIIVYAMPEPAKVLAINDITAALKAETLRHRIAHIVPLDSLSQGHQLIEQGGFGGCVVISME